MTKQDFRIVYFGSPDFAVPPLKALLAAGYEVPLVVTQPDRPKGRKRQLAPTAVKEAAQELGIRTLAVANANEPEVIAEIQAAKPDLLVVAAFGQIMREALVATAPMGAINIHGSLLPKYRGASPIQQALIDGEEETGVTIMYIAPRLDSGDMLASVKTAILPEENTGLLRERLSHMGAKLLVETVAKMRAGEIEPIPQNEDEVTYAGKITAEMERLDWQKSAKELHSLVRGLTPDTSAFCSFEEQGEVQRLKIWQTKLLAEDFPEGTLGEVMRADKDGLVVKCNGGALKLLVVQAPGKGQMQAADWWRGKRDFQVRGLILQ